MNIEEQYLTIKEVKTRKDHECEYCHKKISKGEIAKVYQEEGSRRCYQEGMRGGRGGSYYAGKWFHRRYWHKDCPTKIKRSKTVSDMTDKEFEDFLNHNITPWEEIEVE